MLDCGYGYDYRQHDEGREFEPCGCFYGDAFFGCRKIKSIEIVPNVHVAKLFLLAAIERLCQLDRTIEIAWAPCTYRTLAGDLVQVTLPESMLKPKTDVTKLVWETVAAELKMQTEDIYFARNVLLFRPTITVSVLRMPDVRSSRRRKARRDCVRDLNLSASEGGGSNICKLPVALAVESGASDKRAAAPTTLRYARAKIGAALGIPSREIRRLELRIGGIAAKPVRPKGLDMPLAGLLGDGTFIAVSLRGRLRWPKVLAYSG